jgi:outer membrane protein assembly factor BamD
MASYLVQHGRIRFGLAALMFGGVLGGAALGCGGGAGANGSYGANARKAYADALDEYYDNDCFAAVPMLRNVRKQFPYTRFAALADLRIADCDLKDGKHAEAIEAYNQFVRYRPSHPEVPYARFQAAFANFDQIPSEWLLSPPAYERDQRYAQESLRLLRRFVLDFPDDPLVPRAQRMAERVVKLLAAHEMYVAKFYYDRDRPRAAAGRLNTLLRSYPGSSYDPEALYLLGESYMRMKDPKGARRAFKELLARYPNHDRAEKAQDELQEIGG